MSPYLFDGLKNTIQQMFLACKTRANTEASGYIAIGSQFAILYNLRDMVWYVMNDAMTV